MTGERIQRYPVEVKERAVRTSNRNMHFGAGFMGTLRVPVVDGDQSLESQFD